MATWADLDAELSLWHRAGQIPTFWWRDDDAHAATDALEPLLALSETHAVPVHLAVIPAKLQPSLAPRLARSPHVLTMQHGLAHVNHEPKGSGASEFGDQRTEAAIKRDLEAGWKVLKAAGLPHLLRAFVPPWNRMSAVAVRTLDALGYRAVSAYEGHTPDTPLPKMIRADGHIDPIRWKQGHVFRGEAAMLRLITAHLAARREGRADALTPTGYLTHHLETGDDIWDFTAVLFDHLAKDNRAEWIRLPTLFRAT